MGLIYNYCYLQQEISIYTNSCSLLTWFKICKHSKVSPSKCQCLFLRFISAQIRYILSYWTQVLVFLELMFCASRSLTNNFMARPISKRKNVYFKSGSYWKTKILIGTFFSRKCYNAKGLILEKGVFPNDQYFRDSFSPHFFLVVSVPKGHWKEIFL